MHWASSALEAGVGPRHTFEQNLSLLCTTPRSPRLRHKPRGQEVNVLPVQTEGDLAQKFEPETFEKVDYISKQPFNGMDELTLSTWIPELLAQWRSPFSGLAWVNRNTTSLRTPNLFGAVSCVQS